MNRTNLVRYHVLGCMLFFELAAFSQNTPINKLQKYLFNQDYNNIICLTQNEFRKDSNKIDLYYYQAFAYREIFQFENSILSCLNGIEKGDESQEMLKILAQNYVSLNLDNEALEIYELLNQKDTGNIQVKVQLARLYQNFKRYEDAINIYENLIQKDSLNSYLYKQLGLCLLENNDTSAMRILVKAVKLNPKDISVAIKLANKYNDLRYHANAIAILNYVIPYNKDSYQLYKVKAYTHFLLRDNEPAVESFKKVLALGDTTRFTLKYLGYAYFELEDFESSYNTLYQVLEFDSTDTRVYFHLSIAARKLYKTEESVALMDKSIKLLFPNDRTISLYYTQAAENFITFGARKKIKGFYTEEKEAYKKAIGFYELAYKADTSNKSLLYQIGSTYDSYLDEKTKALVYYTDYKNSFRQYIEETDEQFALRLEYINNRIQKIREDLHFEGELNN